MKVLLNICTHGDEHIGLAVARQLKNLKLQNGELIIHVANKRAFKLKKRFVDQDLNRSFPGKPLGNHEERLAYTLLPAIRSADIVLDIHSTTSGLRDALIVTYLSKRTREYVRVINPKYLLLLSATKNNALISSAKVGMAFEYGKERDPRVVKRVVRDIKKLLRYTGMLAGPRPGSRKRRSISLEVYSPVPKPEGARLMRKIKNYQLVKKGTVYGVCGKKKLVAKRDFYPILFGEVQYQDIFGFAGRILSVKQ